MGGDTIETGEKILDDGSIGQSNFDQTEAMLPVSFVSLSFSFNKTLKF